MEEERPPIETEIEKREREAEATEKAFRELEEDIPPDWLSAEYVAEGCLLAYFDLMTPGLPMEFGPETAKIGSLLLAINHEPVDKCSYTVIRHRLKYTERPLSLIFATDVDCVDLERILRSQNRLEDDYDREGLPILRRKRVYDDTQCAPKWFIMEMLGASVDERKAARVKDIDAKWEAAQEEIKETFDLVASLDGDSDTISLEELHEIADADFDVVFTDMDTDEDDVVSWDEWHFYLKENFAQKSMESDDGGHQWLKYVIRTLRRKYDVVLTDITLT